MVCLFHLQANSLGTAKYLRIIKKKYKHNGAAKRLAKERSEFASPPSAAGCAKFMIYHGRRFGPSGNLNMRDAPQNPLQVFLF